MADAPNPGGRANHPPQVIVVGGNTTGASSLGTLRGAAWSVSAAGKVSAGFSNGSIVLSAPAQTNQTLGLYAVSNTEGASSSSTFDARTLSFQGRGAVSVGYSNGSIVIDAPSAAAGNVTFSAGANSAGLASIVFSNSNGVSFGLNGSTITASAAGGGTGSLYAQGNSTQNSSTTQDFSSLQFGGRGGVSVGFSGGTIQVSAPALSTISGVAPIEAVSNGSTISISCDLINAFEPLDNGNVLITNSVLGQSSLYFYPIDVPWPLSASRINVFLSIGSTTSGVNSTGAGSYGVGYALYTRMTGTGSDRVSQLTSYSAQIWTYTFSSNTRFGVTFYNGLSNATSHSTSTYSSAATNVSTFVANSLGGYRAVALPIGLTLTPGRYWLGISNQTTTVNTNAFAVSASVLQQTGATIIGYRPFGTSSAASNASFFGPIAGMGTYSAQSAGWPNSIPLTSDSIRQPLTVVFPFANISGISTSTNML